jgi:hypothetical protein
MNGRSSNNNLKADGKLVFLSDHVDANRLSALFVSLSSEQSGVACVKGNVVVATLTVPAGFSLVHTADGNPPGI